MQKNVRTVINSSTKFSEINKMDYLIIRKIIFNRISNVTLAKNQNNDNVQCRWESKMAFSSPAGGGSNGQDSYGKQFV